MAKRRDPIVEQVRRTRQRHARKFNYDLKRIFADLKEWERKHVRNPISRPAKPALRKTGT